MTKGTPSFGKHNKRATHIICRRCGNHSYNRQKRQCVSCGFGKTAKRRVYKWRKVKDPKNR
ncbi:MAG: 50S ribosomal protein L37e [Methanobacteriota archaeon]|nr:MAG: 50S ribosomal protein L37e [Euryarchaeota archaeon]